MGTEVRVMQPPREARKRRQEGTLSDGETPGAAWPFQPLDLGLLASRPWRTHSVAASPSFVVLWYKSLRELKPHVPQLFLGWGPWAGSFRLLSFSFLSLESRHQPHADVVRVA